MVVVCPECGRALVLRGPERWRTPKWHLVHAHGWDEERAERWVWRSDVHLAEELG